MTDIINNPLKQYYRQPTVYVKLPSQGQWWNADDIDIPHNGELAIYPMSARDEILIKTPDALMNGQSIVSVIQSCCPQIRNAWSMPSVDVDTLLIAIRIATYGNNMQFDSSCRHCEHKNTHEVELGTTLEGMRCPDFTELVYYQDLKIKLRPAKFFLTNRINQINFEEQKMLSAVNNADISTEQRSEIILASMNRIIDIGIESCVNSTAWIEMPDGNRVDGGELIKDFYQNAEQSVLKLIQDSVLTRVQQVKTPPFQLQCDNCHGDYQADLEFNYSNFFARGF